MSNSKKQPKSKFYTLSKEYYDSTLSVVDSNFYNFGLISERQEILERFVDQVVIVERQDSLLRWANMDSTELATLIERLAQEEEAVSNAIDKAETELAQEERQIDEELAKAQEEQELDKAEFEREFAEAEEEDRIMRQRIEQEIPQTSSKKDKTFVESQ